MRVNKISKLNTATYNNYTWPEGLESFSDTNILLGWNGSGKTVVSRIFKHLELKNDDFSVDSDAFTVEIDGNNFSKTDVGTCSKSIRVFNEAYIKSIMGQGLLPHVFYLGDVQVDYSDKERRLETLRGNKKTCVDESSSFAKTAIELIQGVDGILSITKQIETSGTYRYYSVNSFKKRVEKITGLIAGDAEISVDSFKLSDEALAEHRQQLKSQSAQEEAFNLLKKHNDWLGNNNTRIQGLLDAIPTQQASSRIEAFDKESKELRWVQQGVQIHFENEGAENREVCIFCNNKINNQEELQKHFSRDFMHLTNELDTAEGYVKSAIVEVKAVVGYSDIKPSIQAALTDIQSKIIEKRKDFSEVQTLAGFTSCFEENQEYSLGNVSASAWEIEAHYVATVYIDYTTKEKEYADCIAEQDENRRNISKVEGEIDELKAKEANIHVPADKLSRLLNTAFPYKKIEIKNSKTGIGYDLYRKDEVCDFSSLSEGGRNFIALAYFLVSINNKKGESIFDDKGIVVIDDPVSSLDKGTIFQIFSILLREIQRNKERQYFILTHNLDFYGHLLQGVYKKSGDSDEENGCNLYQITYDASGSKIVEMNKFLRDFKSDYIYTMHQLWDKKDNCDMADAIWVANLMRRCWETFLHFKFAAHGDLSSMLDKAYNEAGAEKLIPMGEDLPDARKQEIQDEFKEAKIEMYRFLNYGSHEYGDVDTNDESILQGVNERLINFFAVVKLLDKHHYAKITTTT